MGSTRSADWVMGSAMDSAKNRLGEENGEGLGWGFGHSVELGLSDGFGLGGRLIAMSSDW